MQLLFLYHITYDWNQSVGFITVSRHRYFYINSTGVFEVQTA